MDKISRKIIKVLIAFLGLFMGLIFYLSYFEIFQADKVIIHPYNKRQWINEEHVLRGIIADRFGKTLASSEKTEKGQIRKYPFKNIYSHLIGYSDKEYGKAGLELYQNNRLLDLNDNPIEEITEKITGPKTEGNRLILTIDHVLQTLAEKKMRGKKGAVVLMNPKTGEIYAMISKPDFDPTQLKDKWREITESKDSPLLNRATSGLYPPGSVFKVITATAVLENSNIQTTFDCKGFINIDGYRLKDSSNVKHGKVDLKKALEKSCNVAFSQMGIQLGQDVLLNEAKNYLFNQTIPFDLPTKKASFPVNHLSKPQLAMASIGQGQVLVTPLQMAMVSATIANNGKMMEPFLVKEVINKDDKTVKMHYTKTLSRVSNLENINKLKEMMVAVVDHGTGYNAKIRGVKVAGKTGTAQNESDLEHAWFIGFAPANDPKVAIAVVLENEGGYGGTKAAPIAKVLMETALHRVD